MYLQIAFLHLSLLLYSTMFYENNTMIYLTILAGFHEKYDKRVAKYPFGCSSVKKSM